MRRQTRSKLAELTKSFPPIGRIRFDWRKKVNGKWREPITNVHVQRADCEAMHLQARNIGYSDRMYLMSDDDSERGMRTQYLWAINTDDRVIAALRWGKGELEKLSKHIFSVIENSEEVSYLLWITAVEWYPAASPEREKETSGILFGEELQRVELFITVYRQPQGMTWTELITKADFEKFEREDAQNHTPKEMSELPHLHQALRDGCRLHAFLSGGGLRVVSLSIGEDDKAYGEHPHMEVALTHLDEDYAAGGREYNAMYGPGGLYTGYLTGSTLPTSNLDAWVRRGNRIDVWQEGNEVVFQLDGYTHYEMPDSIEDYTKANPGVPIQWSSLRGITYEGVYQENFFPNGEPSYSMRMVHTLDKKRDPFFYPSTKTGRGDSFWAAMLAAFKAPEEESLRAS